MAHKLGAEFHLPHGMLVSILLPHVIRYNGTDCPTKFASFPKYEYYVAKHKYADISRRLNFPAYTDDEGLESLIRETRNLSRDIGIPQSLKEAGVDEQEFLSKVDELADRAFSGPMYYGKPKSTIG